MPAKLAKDGGEKTIKKPIPHVYMHGTNAIGKEEKKYVVEALKRKLLFRFFFDEQSSFVTRFENEFKEKMGTKHALAVSSGTASLLSGLVGLEIGPGDEVIVPGYTFIVSASSIISVGAVPVIAEIDDTLTMDPDDVEKKITPYTKAIMPVHMRGIPCDMDRIMAIAKKHNLFVIEDTAQADGASYKGKRLGSIGDVGCFSLQAGKVITSGEGGVLITNDDRTYARAAMYHDSAICFWNNVKANIDSPIPGGGMRMSEVTGAIAYAQIKKLDSIIETNRQRKKEILDGISGIKHLSPIRIPDAEGEAALMLNLRFKTVEEAKVFAEALYAEGVAVGTIHNEGFPDRHIYRYWEYVLNKVPIQKKERACSWYCPHYKGNVSYSQDMCPKTMDYLSRTVAIYINQQMKPSYAKAVVRAVKKVCRALY